jgi:hypothetical protein
MGLCSVWLVIDWRGCIEVKVFQRLNSIKGIELQSKTDKIMPLTYSKSVRVSSVNQPTPCLATYSRLAIEPFQENLDGHQTQN